MFQLRREIVQAHTRYIQSMLGSARIRFHATHHYPVKINTCNYNIRLSFVHGLCGCFSHRHTIVSFVNKDMYLSNLPLIAVNINLHNNLDICSCA
jgi:hypothetical protein